MTGLKFCRPSAPFWRKELDEGEGEGEVLCCWILAIVEVLGCLQSLINRTNDRGSRVPFGEVSTLRWFRQTSPEGVPIGDSYNHQIILFLLTYIHLFTPFFSLTT